MLWFAGGQVYEVETGRFRRASMSVEGERIVAMTDSARPAAEDTIIDVTGLYLLPGFIDCHVHLVMPTDEPDPSVVAGWPDAMMAIYATKAAERTLLGG